MDRKYIIISSIFLIVLSLVIVASIFVYNSINKASNNFDEYVVSDDETHDDYIPESGNVRLVDIEMIDDDVIDALLEVSKQYLKDTGNSHDVTISLYDYNDSIYTLWSLDNDVLFDVDITDCSYSNVRGRE